MEVKFVLRSCNKSKKTGMMPLEMRLSHNGERKCIYTGYKFKELDGCFFSRFSHYQTQVRKKNKMKVLVAVARKLLIAVWHVLHDQTDYKDFDPDRRLSATNG